MTEFRVVGLDRNKDERLARRLRAIARDAHVPIHVRVVADALDVMRVGQLGACRVVDEDGVSAEIPLKDATLAQFLRSHAYSETAERV